MTEAQLREKYPFLKGEDLKMAAHVSGLIDNPTPNGMRVLEDIVRSSLRVGVVSEKDRKSLIIGYAKVALERQIQVSKELWQLDQG